MKEVEWFELWRELVRRSFLPKTEKIVERYKAHSWKRTERPDPLLDFILKEIDAQDTFVKSPAPRTVQE